jgi:Trk-type K+ transport system membrane component
LIILGAIGFPVLIEISDYLSQRHLKQKYTFSLYTKITTSTFFLLVFLGALLFFMFEREAFLADKTWHESFFYSLFNSVTTRSGGLATMDISLLTMPTLLVLSALMFIGASPSSVGGGIRTTTLFVLLFSMISYMRGRTEIKVFKRELHPEDMIKSFLVFFFAVSFVVISVTILMYTERFSLMEVVFEVCSAFGTSGLSMGITPELSTVGKTIIITLMFVGRIGILTFLFLLKRDERKTTYHYPKERIIIG